MSIIIKNTKNKIFYISPKEVKYCIYPSKYCDYTHVGLSKSDLTPAKIEEFLVKT